MQKPRKIPQRQCVGCREMKEKKALLRIVRTPEGQILLDGTGKKSGRGAYVCPDPACLKKARKNRSLERAFAALEADPDVVIADTARHAGSGTSFGYLTKMVASEQEASASDPTGGNGASFCYIHKQKDGRDIYFFTNSSNDSISTPVSLRGRLKLQRWDPFTGETTGLASRRERRSGGTYTHFELDLPPVSGVFVVGERRE